MLIPLIIILLILIISTVTLRIFRKLEIKKIYAEGRLEFILYRVTNIYFTLFKIFMYMLLTVFLFLAIRYTYIGTFTELAAFNLTITYYQTATFIIIILIFTYYIRLLDLLFYKDVLKMHFWLQRNEYYLKFGDYLRDIVGVSYIKHKIEKIWVTLHNVLEIKESSEREHAGKKTRELGLDDNALLPSVKLSFFLRDLSKKYKSLRLILNIIRKIAFYIAVDFTGLTYALPYTILILVLSYDIYNHRIYYSHYVLFFVMVLVFIRKIRWFIYTKDCALDPIIHNYIYHNDIVTALTVFDELVEYANKDYTVYHWADSDRIFNWRLRLLSSKTRHTIFIFLLAFIYILYTRENYSIVLNIIQLNIPIFMLLIPLILLIYLHKNMIIGTSLFERDTLKKRYNMLFWTLVVIQAFIYILLIFKNRIICGADEVLWDYVFTLMQVFTPEQKFIYMLEYCKCKLELFNINNLNHLLLVETYNGPINLHIPLKDIRLAVDNAITNYLTAWIYIDVRLFVQPYDYTFKKIGILIAGLIIAGYQITYYIKVGVVVFKIYTNSTTIIKYVIPVLHTVTRGFIRRWFNNKK